MCRKCVKPSECRRAEREKNKYGRSGETLILNVLGRRGRGRFCMRETFVVFQNSLSLSMISYEHDGSRGQQRRTL